MDKEKGNWFLSMIGKTKKALFAKLPMTQSLETEKCTEGKFSKVLKALYLYFQSALPLYLDLDYKMYSVNIDILGNDVKHAPPNSFFLQWEM